MACLLAVANALWRPDQVNKRILFEHAGKLRTHSFNAFPLSYAMQQAWSGTQVTWKSADPEWLVMPSSDIKTAGVPKLISPVNSNEGGGGLCYASRRFSLRHVRNTLLEATAHIASCALNPSPDSQDSDCMSRALRCGTEVLWVTAQTNANRVNRDPTNSTATGVSVWSQKHTSRSFEGYSIHPNYNNNNNTNA